MINYHYFFKNFNGEKAILIWYGKKMRFVPHSVICRKFLFGGFDLRNLKHAVVIQIYSDNVIRIRSEIDDNIFIENVSEKTLNAFLEIINSEEDYLAFKNRFKAVEIDAVSCIHIIVNKNDSNGDSYKELPIKVYGFLKPMRLSNGEIAFSYQNMCDEVSFSELADIEENLKEKIQSRCF